jgi:hypothetical protein
LDEEHSYMIRSIRWTRALSLGFLVLMMLLAVSSASFAKDQTLQFPAGQTGTTVQGAVIRGEQEVYKVTAKAGQTLSVQITSLEENAVFQIYLPGGGDATLEGAGEGEDAMTFKGKLPKSGTYRISVGPTRGNAEFTMKVEITN